jgi:hypothetical protein
MSSRIAGGLEVAMFRGNDEVVTDDGGVEVRKRMVVEYGVELDGVWLPLAMLRRLTTHGPWDRPFTEATTDQERVLVAHSLADPHNEIGLRRGAGLSGFLDAVPFEPTVPFPVVPDGQPDRGPDRHGAYGRPGRARHRR